MALFREERRQDEKHCSRFKADGTMSEIILLSCSWQVRCGRDKIGRMLGKYSILSCALMANRVLLSAITFEINHYQYRDTASPGKGK